MKICSHHSTLRKRKQVQRNKFFCSILTKKFCFIISKNLFLRSTFSRILLVKLFERLHILASKLWSISFKFLSGSKTKQVQKSEFFFIQFGIKSCFITSKFLSVPFNFWPFVFFNEFVKNDANLIECLFITF